MALLYVGGGVGMPRCSDRIVRAIHVRPREHRRSRTADIGTVQYLERMLRDSDGGGGGGGAGERGRLRVAYQGGEGSYGHEAAERSGAATAVACEGPLEAAFLAVAEGRADRAVVVAENSVDGPVHRNTDLLLRHAATLVICAEILVPVRHCLLAGASASASAAGLAGVSAVAGHPQGLLHCRRSLRTLLPSPSPRLVPVDDAAAAARALADADAAGTAVVGSGAAARAFGLRVLAEDLQDDPSNTNRFWVLSRRRPSAVAAGPKMTVALALREGADGLCRALAALHECGVGVERLDARPNRGAPMRGERFDYVFVLDLNVEMCEAQQVSMALRRLSQAALSMRVLGSYSTSSSSSD